MGNPALFADRPWGEAGELFADGAHRNGRLGEGLGRRDLHDRHVALGMLGPQRRARRVANGQLARGELPRPVRLGRAPADARFCARHDVENMGGCHQNHARRPIRLRRRNQETCADLARSFIQRLVQLHGGVDQADRQIPGHGSDSGGRCGRNVLSDHSAI